MENFIYCAVIIKLIALLLSLIYKSFQRKITNQKYIPAKF